MWTRRSGSLRLRLALTFALGSMTALVAVSALTDWTFEREITARNGRLLEQRILEVASILRQGRHSDLEQEVLGEGSEFADPPTWVRVLTGPATTIETRGMNEHMPVSWFTGLPRVRTHGRLFILEERAIGLHRIQGAMEITRDEQLLANHRKRLIYGLLFGSSLCAGFGWWAANRGLRPIRAIEQSTRNITAHRLRERLDPGTVPKELRNLVHALNDMLDRLEKAFARLSQFSADLAHEFRTPINNLMGEAEVALSCERPGEEYRQVLESSLEEFRRLSHLITRMLFLARTEDPQASIRAGEIQPQRLVNEVLAFFEAAAEEQGIRLEGRASGALRGDAELLRQALANLVANALQATPRGGLVQVTITPAAQGVEILVRDSGRGIPPDERTRVFDRFARTRASLDGKLVGTGLGLAIVHSIARLHGGTVGIESVPGKGTAIRMVLPG